MDLALDNVLSQNSSDDTSNDNFQTSNQDNVMDADNDDDSKTVMDFPPYRDLSTNCSEVSIQDNVMDTNNQEIDAVMRYYQDDDNILENDEEEFSLQDSPTQNSPEPPSLFSNLLINFADEIESFRAEFEPFRNHPGYPLFLKFWKKYAALFAVFLIKFLFDHMLGIISFIGWVLTLCHANKVIKREVARKDERKLLTVVQEFFCLVMCIMMIYSTLADKELLYALVFLKSYTSHICFWEVLWIASVTDYVITFLTALVKICLLAVTEERIAFCRRGNYYQFIERTSMLYRCLAPIPHWFYYIYTGTSKEFGVILAVAYLVLKFKIILKRMKKWKRSFLKVKLNNAIGVSPSVDQINEAGNLCPICSGDYTFPTMLPCKHIFCEDCVARWLDQRNTCPVCRAKIEDDLTARNGFTSFSFQFI